MDKLKQWIALTVVGVLAVLAGGWFLLVSPKHSDAAALRSQAAQQVSANASLQTQLAMLKAQAKNLPAQQAKLAAVAAKIPDNPALPSLVRALTKAADQTGVELVSLAPSQPIPVAGGATATAVAPGGAAPVSGSAGQLQSIGLVLNVVGGYFQVEQFLDSVENLSRAMKVTNFVATPGGNPLKPTAGTTATASTLSTTVTGTVYMATGRPTTAVAPVGK